MIDFNQLFLLEDPVIILGFIAFCLLLGALPFSFWSISSVSTSLVTTISVGVSNLVLTLLLVIRWVDSGHFPISNLYESLCFLGWACTLTQLLLQRSLPNPLIPAICTPLSLLLIAFASFALPEQLRSSSPLVPALRSSWLIMHVSVIMCSYAALLVGSLLSFLVLFIDRKQEFKIIANSLGVGGFTGQKSIRRSLNSSINNQINSSPFGRLELLDNLSYRSISVGFLLLTVGLISGAVWANEAWGSWWSWDPKETWALICWLIYAAYLHTRLTKGWQGRRPAIVASIGFVFIFICYIGVNLMGLGLHSYGWFF